MVLKAVKEKNYGWMTVDIRRRVLALRSTDAFKKRSAPNKKNKVIGPKVGTVHTSRSISASQWARRMVLVTYLSLLIIYFILICKCSNKYYMCFTLSWKAQKDGQRPTASEIYKQLHTRKEGSEIVFCDNWSKVVWISQYFSLTLIDIQATRY